MMMNENQQAIKTESVEQKASDRFNAKEQIKKKLSVSGAEAPFICYFLVVNESTAALTSAARQIRITV